MTATLPRMTDDFRHLIFEIEGEADSLTGPPQHGASEWYQQVGYRILELTRRLQRLADELGSREWDRGSG